MKGSIKFFDQNRFFGFIIEDGGREVFVHGKDCLFDPSALDEGVKVSFQEGEDERSGRMRAVKVQLVED